MAILASSDPVVDVLDVDESHDLVVAAVIDRLSWFKEKPEAGARL